MRILFANIGWMINYQGFKKFDPIQGGGDYDNEDKHEAFNFQRVKNSCYGYVQTVNSSNIHLKRIDQNANCNQKSLEKVLVIWTARRPQKGGTCIIGWYKDATVYSQTQNSESAQRNYYSYNIKAAANNCILLPVDDRIFNIPRANAKDNKGFMGRSNVWYADNNSTIINKFKDDVMKYIKSYTPNKIQKRKVIKINTELKKKVEQKAINFVTQEYSKKGYEVKSVEKENVGWDLEAQRNKIQLHLEVKGLSGSAISVHLTPNEYKQMKEKKNSDYRLCIVTSALTKPLLSTFIYENEQWICIEDNRIRLTFKEQIAAQATSSSL